MKPDAMWKPKQAAMRIPPEALPTGRSRDLMMDRVMAATAMLVQVPGTMMMDSMAVMVMPNTIPV